MSLRPKEDKRRESLNSGLRRVYCLYSLLGNHVREISSYTPDAAPPPLLPPPRRKCAELMARFAAGNTIFLDNLCELVHALWAASRTVSNSKRTAPASPSQHPAHGTWVRPSHIPVISTLVWQSARNMNRGPRSSSRHHRTLRNVLASHFRIVDLQIETMLTHSLCSQDESPALERGLAAPRPG